jgi:uncharacterized protein (DUF433 family)
LHSGDEHSRSRHFRDAGCENVSSAEILADFPDLEQADIQACTMVVALDMSDYEV